MPPTSKSRLLLLVWTAVLGAPFAWAASLGAMFWLTHPVCQGMTHTAIVAVGSTCAVLAAGAGALAHYLLRHSGATAAIPGSGAFLLKVALGSSPMFALVILLSMVPIAMLTPCPV
jgi:hypothetical protein